jgi:hypothetical protein
MRRLALTLVAATLGLTACAVQSDSDDPGAPEASEPVALGPVDGRDLPATDLERIQVGDLAPDFSLASLGGPVITLSDFRGDKNVILVFYRGYW